MASEHTSDDDRALAHIEAWIKEKPHHTCGGLLCYCGECHYCEEVDGDPYPDHYPEKS